MKEKLNELPCCIKASKRVSVAQSTASNGISPAVLIRSVRMDARLVFLALLICAPLAKSTNQEDLAAWFKENSEIFVILKHWNELPLVSTAWKRIKDTPSITKSRESIKKGFDSLINMCDCSKKSGSSMHVPLPSSDICSGNNCTSSILKTTEFTQIDRTKDSAVLEDRVIQLEATLKRLNESFHNSQVRLPSRTSSAPKTVIDTETLKIPVNNTGITFLFIS